MKKLLSILLLLPSLTLAATRDNRFTTNVDGVTIPGTTKFGTLVGTFVGDGSGLTNVDSAVRVFPLGIVVGPNGLVNTIGTTTAGINEAINSVLTATSIFGPAGGGRITIMPGTYKCSGQIGISNRFPNPIILEGVQDGPSPGTVLDYTGTNDFLVSQAPLGSGMIALWLRNLTITSEAVCTNRLIKLTDVYQFRADSVLLCGYGKLTNDNFSGFISQYIPVQAAGLVGMELGAPIGTDYQAGVVELYDVRFWGLAAGGSATIDHQFIGDTSFACIGGSSKTIPTTNLWPVGAIYHYPESCYALHPGWVNGSAGGDVLFRGRWSSFQTYCAFLNTHSSSLGDGPTMVIDASAQLEAATYLILQYDDVNQQLNIYSPASATTRSGVSTVHKPGTITGVLPPKTRFSRFGVETYGETNVLYFGKGEAAALNNTPFAMDVGNFPTFLFEAGDVGGRNIIRGNSYLDKINVGVSVDLSHCTVAAGTDSGINGTYTLKGRAYRSSFVSLAWTNAAWTILQNDDDSGFGGFYTNGDTSFAHEQYYNATPSQLGADMYIAAAGLYDADAGAGTPPTVTFPLATNVSTFLGGLASTKSIAAASSAITFPNTTVKWTNANEFNIVLYINNSGVTVTSISKNNQQIFGSLANDTTLFLKPGDYFSEAYTGSPSARWEPQ